MAYAVQETGELTRVAEITIPAAEYQREVNRALKQLSGRVRVPGFRPGNIPMNVLRQRYGDSVTRDVIEGIIERQVNTVAREQPRLLFIGTPTVTSIPVKGEGDLEFNVPFELRPELDPIGYMGLEIEKPDTEVDSSQIDEQLEQMREQLASLKPIEFRTTIQKGDIVTFDFEFVSDREDLQQFKGEDAQLEVGAAQVLPGINEALEGAEFGAVLEPSVTLDAGFPIEDMRGQQVPVRLTIKAVQQRVLPELNDEFASQTGEAETLLDLRSKVRQQLESQREHQAMHIAEDNLLEKLLEQNDFELPPAFLDAQLTEAARQRLQMFQRQGLDIEQLQLSADALKESIREQTVREIKAEFLLLAIAEKEQLKVEDADMNAYFEHRAMHSGVSARQLEQFMRQDSDRWRQAEGGALLEKTRQFLLSEATIKTVAWPTDDEEDAEDVEVTGEPSEGAGEAAVDASAGTDEAASSDETTEESSEE